MPGTITLRPGNREDAEVCGRICHDAFADIAERHNFPKDFPSPAAAAGALSGILSHAGVYAVIAERDGRIVGSNFLDERSPIGGIGPISVDPEVQDSGIGRRLMEAVLQRAAERQAAGVRLLQDAFHNRSFALYTRLGFQTRLTTSVLQGSAVQVRLPGYDVRPATPADVDACNRLCLRVHGHHRGGELLDAIRQGSALVVERQGHLSGYATAVAMVGHAVAETTDDLKALIGAAPAYGGPGFHVPNSNHELLCWCYDQGLRMVKAMTLMTIGLYNEPRGAYLPSVLY